MLQTTNPEILEVVQILENIDTLLAKGFPLARKMEQCGRLDLDCIESLCGTYKCLLGWSQQFFPDIDFAGSMVAAERKAFGFVVGDWRLVFGMAYNGTLDDREHHVRNVIRPRHQARLNELLNPSITREVSA